MRTYDLMRYGRKWNIAADDAIMEDRYQVGEFCEQPMIDWILAMVPVGGLWVDAGANIGNHALPFALSADLVICFEPMGMNTTLLRRNAIENDLSERILCLELGVGARSSAMHAVPGGTGKNCQWELRSDGAPSTAPRVVVVAIDSVIPDKAEVRLMKLDVEGMEAEAIAGAWATIERCKPELFIEIWKDDELARIRATLAGLGYILIERWNHAPTYHFSASGRYPVTYTPPA